MEPISTTRVFVGYEMAPGCEWNGMYMVRTLEESADVDLSNEEFDLVPQVAAPSQHKGVRTT